MKEVKVTFPEGGWVSLVLVDDLDGYVIDSTQCKMTTENVLDIVFRVPETVKNRKFHLKTGTLN